MLCSFLVFFFFTFEFFPKPSQFVDPSQHFWVCNFITVGGLKWRDTITVFKTDSSQKYRLHCGGLLHSLPTLYFRSSSNFSSNLWIFFFSTWILLVSWAEVSSSRSSSQEPREELRLRLDRKKKEPGQHRHLLYSRITHEMMNLRDKRVRVGRGRRYFRVVQVLLAMPVGVEARGHHRVTVLLQQLADQTTPSVRGQSGFLAVHALPL